MWNELLGGVRTAVYAKFVRFLLGLLLVSFCNPGALILILTIVWGELVKLAVVVGFVRIRAGHCWKRRHTMRLYSLYKHTMLYSQWKHQQS